MSRTHSATRIALGTVLLIAMAWAGYQQIFSTFAEYDDEGYVMLSLARFMAGDPLYDETYTQYGPAYFFLHGSIHRWLDWGVTHDITRLKTLAQWLATACISSWVVFRLTGSQWLSVAALLGVFFHLDKLCLEPGHPQELASLLTAILLLSATYVVPNGYRSPRPSPRWSNWRSNWRSYWRSYWRSQAPVFVMGVAAGAMVMTKINIGGLTCLAAALAFSSHLNSRCAAWITWTLTTLCCAMPWALMWPSLASFQACLLPIVTSVGCLLVTITLQHLKSLGALQPAASPSPNTKTDALSRWMPLLVFAAGAILTAGSFVGLAVLNGTSTAGVWYGLVGQHRQFTGTFFHAAPIHWLAVVVGIVSVALCIMVCGTRRVPFAGRSGYASLAALVVVGVGAALGGALVATGSPLRHGLIPRGGVGALVTIAPCIWLMLFSPALLRKDSAASHCALCPNSFARTVLGFGAVLWPLASYPTPGIQFETSTFPLLLAVFVAAHEVFELTWLQRAGSESVMIVRNRATAAMSIALLTLITLCARDAAFYHRRSQLAAVNLHGASLLRMEPDMAARQQWITNTLKDHCDTFLFAQHGLNRFYFWTQSPPPTSLNPTFWPFLLNEQQQRRIVAAASRHSRLGIVDLNYSKSLPAGAPLSNFMEQDSTEIHERGEVRIRIRQQAHGQ